MGHVDRAVSQVRTAAAAVLRSCVEALDAGMAVERIHGYYVQRVAALLEDAEVQALLAQEGDPEAMRVVERCRDGLRQLAAELLLERAQEAGEDG